MQYFLYNVYTNFLRCRYHKIKNSGTIIYFQEGFEIGIITVLTSVYKSIAYWLLSLPIPDFLYPPNGTAASKLSKQLTHTVPDRKFLERVLTIKLKNKNKKMLAC